MAVAPGDVIEVTAVLAYGGAGEIDNVWHLRTTGGGTIADADADVDIQNEMAELYTEFDSSLADVCTAQEIRWRNVTDNSPTRIIPWGTSFTGGLGSGDALPPGTALLLLLRTGVLGVTGKKYLGAMSEARQGTGTWGVSMLADASEVRDHILAGFVGEETGVTYEYCVFSRTLEEAFPVLSIGISPNVAYQRRRRAGRGS